MPAVKVNDINMCYEIHGESEPLIMIQGMGIEISSVLKTMESFVLEFAKKYRVIAFDNRGAGITDRPDEPYCFEMMAEDAIGLMDKLNIKSAHVLGISMGSRIALVIAAKYPERVKSLILNVAAAGSTCDDPQAARSYAAMTQPGFLRVMKVIFPLLNHLSGNLRLLRILMVKIC